MHYSNIKRNGQNFYFGFNYLNSIGAMKIARGLRKTTTLIKLNMASNMITDEAADDIAAFLTNNRKLREINLSFNFLQPEGIRKIAKNMSSLKLFNISHNMIPAKAISSIKEILNPNTKLEICDLHFTHAVQSLKEKILVSNALDTI